MTQQGFRRLSMSAVVCLALPVGLGAGTGPSHAAAGCEDCDLIVSIQSGPVVWEEPDPEFLNQVLVFLSMPAAEPVTVWFRTADGTATAPEDYTAIQQLVTVPEGAQEVAVPIEVRADRIEEQDEFFHASIAEPSVGQIGVGETQVNIRDGGPVTCG